jgi:hypothetical protein
MKSFKIKYGEIQNDVTGIKINFPKIHDSTFTSCESECTRYEARGRRPDERSHSGIPRQELQRVGRLVFTRKSECRCRCNKKKLSDRLDTPYRSASPEEESQGIDGYFGEQAVSIKPITYMYNKTLSEEITIPIVFDEKKKDGIEVVTDLI